MRAVIAIVIVGCASSPPPAPSPAPVASAPRAPVLSDLGWLAGDWHGAELDAHWQTIAGAMYGVALNDRGFEVNIVDDSDDDGHPAPISLVSIRDGRDAMTFALSRATSDELDFADPRGPAVRVTRRGRDGWRGEFTDPPQPAVAIDVTRVAPQPAPELAAADRAFADDTARDGADGWARAFAPDGAQWEHGARIEGDAIRAGIAATLARGQLAWQPVASGVRGARGYTLGTWTFTAGGAVVARGSYVTIWARQPDGTWKVAFDTGRPADAG